MPLGVLINVWNISDLALSFKIIKVYIDIGLFQEDIQYIVFQGSTYGPMGRGHTLGDSRQLTLWQILSLTLILY